MKGQYPLWAQSGIFGFALHISASGVTRTFSLPCKMPAYDPNRACSRHRLMSAFGYTRELKRRPVQSLEPIQPLCVTGHRAVRQHCSNAEPAHVDRAFHD